VSVTSARVAELAQCPLCGGTDAVVVDRVPYERIWTDLEEVWHAHITEPVRKRHAPLAETTLMACRNCGLQYFTPIVPGDAEFYRELMAALPYESERWEHMVVGDLVRREHRVVDLGCGDGAFVRRIAGGVSRAVGVDHNEDAIASLAADGVEAYAADVSSFADAHPGEFDVACAFQVAEHMGNIEALVDAAQTLLRPGGHVYMSTPNRDRCAVAASEPLDAPPHHVSRWAPDQFEALARRYGLRLVSVRFAEPTYAEVALASEHRIKAALGPRRVTRRAAFTARLVRRALLGPRRYGLAAHRGWFTRRGVYGHTMLAEFGSAGTAHRPHDDGAPGSPPLERDEAPEGEQTAERTLYKPLE
jgi:2-polyprenyl-3-methyl-5-hydroxy-6-metoxy-1,4-benzoquinol methylase